MEIYNLVESCDFYLRARRSLAKSNITTVDSFGAMKIQERRKKKRRNGRK